MKNPKPTTHKPHKPRISRWNFRRAIRELEKKLEEHESGLLEEIRDIVMSVADEVKTILAESRDAVRASKTRTESIKTLVTGLRDAAARLEAQVGELVAGNLNDLTPEDLEAIKNTATEIKDATSEVDEIQDDILANTDEEEEEEPPVDPNA